MATADADTKLGGETDNDDLVAVLPAELLVAAVAAEEDMKFGGGGKVDFEARDEFLKADTEMNVGAGGNWLVLLRSLVSDDTVAGAIVGSISSGCRALVLLAADKIELKRNDSPSDGISTAGTAKTLEGAG